MKTITVKTLEDCKRHAASSRDNIKAQILRDLKKYGINEIPVTDMQYGLFINGESNPYEDMDNMIAQFNNSMLTSWKCFIELMSIKQNQIMAKDTEFELLE